MKQVEPIIYPVLLHSLTPDGLDAIDDSLDCIALLIYYSKKGEISQQIWSLIPPLVYIITGKEGDTEEGYGFEYIAQVVVIIQNFIQKDPDTFLTQVPPNGDKPILQYVSRLIEAILKINRNGVTKLDGVSALKVYVAMLENCAGKIDHLMPDILKLLLLELNEMEKL